ncbi:transposase [Streptomyces violaceusniger]|uniref:transposase n=1 Tax=Streptomyces violaceusniger TaxID=68280 RepID=UPI0031D19485
MLAALDPATGKIYYRIRERKPWHEFLGLLKAPRARRPKEKLYVVLDNFSPHQRAEVRTGAADNDIEPVFLPTYGSWPNWIESEFAALRYFALNGTDHRTHDEQSAAIAAYIRRHNSRAEPKTASHLRHPSGIGPNTQPGCVKPWDVVQPSDSDLRRVQVGPTGGGLIDEDVSGGQVTRARPRCRRTVGR